MENPDSPPSPLGLEPAAKKQRMSTTTTSDDEEHDPAVSVADGSAPPVRKPRHKRRKVAIFFGYCGVGYQGMQKNPGAKTIEGDLEEALFHAGAVPEQDRGQPRRFDWARSARTDKGVSAVGQVVSGRFYIDPPGFIDRMNSHLSPQIRIFGYKRTTASFNAKKFCDRRRYVYLIPVFALDPSAHRDRESVLASMGSGNELVKCLECSERGRKVAGVMGKRSFETKNEPNCDILSNTKNSPIHSAENGNEASSPCPEIEKIVESETSLEENGEVTDMEGAKENDKDTLATKRTEFSYGDLEKEKFNRILKYYEGTHNFHNFTTRIKAEDPSAKRYIISIDANTIVHVDGIDFVKCEVVGQSFMLHQIRKMIGLAVAIMRNCSPESLIQTALRKDVHINVPMAPEVGLYLEQCFFTSYNQKWKDHEELSMKDYAGEADDFKTKHIYPHIAATEHKEGLMGLWLHSLNYRNYPDLTFSELEKTVDLKSDEASSDVKNEVSVNGVAMSCHVNKAEELDIATVQAAGAVDSLDGKNDISANAEMA